LLDSQYGQARSCNLVGEIPTPEDRPVLANIYLYYVLDLWFEKVIRPRWTGFARMIRYCENSVVCFQYELDPVKFRRELVNRLGKF